MSNLVNKARDLRVLQIGIRAKPVAPPSPDYILGPQILPVPQDEDEREPMFIQAHDPDYVPEPIYPEYIPLEDDHEFRLKEQPYHLLIHPLLSPPDMLLIGSQENPEGDDDEEDDETRRRRTEHLAPADSTAVPADGAFPKHPVNPSIRGIVERLLTLQLHHHHHLISLSPPLQWSALLVTASIPPPSLHHNTISIHTITCWIVGMIFPSPEQPPTRGQWIDYGFVSTVDAEERRQGIRDVGYGLGITWRPDGWWRRRPMLSPKLGLISIGLGTPDTATAAEYSHSDTAPECRQSLQHGDSERKRMVDPCPSATSAIFTTMALAPNVATRQQIGHFARDCRRHFKRDCPKLKKDGGNGNAQDGMLLGNAEKRGKCTREP
ncbi:hypothetical protein Tco_0105374 [Tanacetum coccineum]